MAASIADRRDMDVSAIALQGYQQAEARLNRAASNIASSPASAAAGSPDTVDLSTQILELMSAKDQAAISLATIETANQVQQNLIDLMA